MTENRQKLNKVIRKLELVEKADIFEKSHRERQLKEAIQELIKLAEKL